jgi:CIC family chloride channel protein
VPRTPLDGYDIVEVSIGAQSPALDRRVDEIDWPTGALVVAVSEGREVVPARQDLRLCLGERVVLLVPSQNSAATNGNRAAGDAEH